MILALGLGLLCLLLSATYSGTEIGLYSLERVRLQIRAAEGHRPSIALLERLRSPAASLSTLLLGNNIVNSGIAWSGSEVLHRLHGGSLGDVEIELRSTLWVVPIVFVFGEVLPKNLFLRHPATLVLLAWPLYRATEVVLAPVVRGLLATLRFLKRPEDPPEASLLRRESLAGILTSDDEAERLDRFQRDMAGRVLALRSLKASELAIPDADLVTVTAGAGREAVLDAAARSGRSRVLIRSPDGADLLGYVNFLDAALSEPAEFRLEEVLHHLPEVPATCSVTEALGVMQRARRPLALIRRAVGPPQVVSTNDIVDYLMTSDARDQAPSRGGVAG